MEPAAPIEEPVPAVAVVEPVEEMVEPPRSIVPELSPEERAKAREARARRMQAFLKIAAVLVLLAGAGFGAIKFVNYWKTRNAGELAIKITPASAAINLVRDGRDWGSRTLYTGLNPGTYVLVVSAPGYESYTNDSLVLEGLSGTSLAKQKEVEVKLSLLVGGASLTISPPDATYNLASATLAAGTSTNLTGKGLATLNNLPLGSYTVRVSRDGYGSQSTNFDVTQTELVRINLELQREMGLLALASTPPGANYRLMGPDDIRRQGTTPATETDLPTGNYTVQ
ncbi:MAG: PEGA domain-containing protein, partial [Desulfobacterales bacterium]|nr:PEGA domain-containing protein [Desulfobacterales bacterium]